MTSREDIVGLYIRAQAGRTAGDLEALSRALSDDIVLATSRGSFEGRDRVLSQIGNAPAATSFQQATWSEPAKEGDALFIKGRLPIEATLAGYDIRFRFDSGGRIERIDQQTLPAPPMPASPMVLSEDLKQLIAGAWNTNPILVAAVDSAGQPRLSLRGTVQAFSDDRLAFWARNAEGGTVGGLSKNPLVTLFYRNPAARTTFYFYGRARVTTDEGERRSVYDNSPEPERLADPQYKGVAVIVELDKVEGVTPAGRVHLAREA